MRKKRGITAVGFLVLFLGLLMGGSMKARAEAPLALGNLPEIAVNGGTIVSAEAGTVYYADTEAGGVFCTQNGESVQITEDEAAGLNLNGALLSYITEEDGSYVIRERNLDSGAERDLYRSETEISQLYRSSEQELYFLTDGAVTAYDLESQTEERYADGEITSFIPVQDGYFYTKESRLPDAALYYNGRLLKEHVSSYYINKDRLILTQDGFTYQITLSDLANGKDPEAQIRIYEAEETSGIAVQTAEEARCAYEADNADVVSTYAQTRTRASEPQKVTSGYETASDRQKNMVKRIRQMTEIQWTPLEDIIGWDADYVFHKGTTYTGLPYGQPIDGVFVPWSTSLSGFIKAVNDIQSKMYTDYSDYATSRAPYYSSDCSAFVSWAWNLTGRRTTSSLPTYGDKIDSSSIYNIQIGDAFVYPGNHTAIVSDIGYNADGTIVYIDIAEQTPPQTQVIRYGTGGRYTLAYLQTKYWNGGYTLYRLKTQYSVTYTHDCAVPIDDSCDNCSLLKAPPVISVKQTGSSTVRFQWNPVPEAYAYGVLRSTSRYGTYTLMDIVGSDRLYYDDSDIKAGTTYYYKVYGLAYKNGTWIEGDVSDSLTISTLETPKNLTVETETDTSLKLTWDAASGADMYGILRSESRDGTYQWLVATNQTSYIDTNCAEGKFYYYKVYAAAGSGTEWVNSDCTEPVSGKTMVGKVSGLTVTGDTAGKKAQLSWLVTEGAYGYGILRAETADGPYKQVATVQTNAYTDQDVDTDQIYYYKVFALEYDGLEWIRGTESDPAAVYFMKAPQIEIDMDETQISLSWTKVKGAEVYGILRAESAKGPYEWIAAAYGETYTDQNAEAGKAYYYKVYAARRAENEWHNGDQSEAVTGVRTLPAVTGVTTEPGAGIHAIKVSWKPVEHASRYGVLRADAKNGVYEWIGAVSDTSFTDTNLQPWKTYYYKIYGTVSYDGVWYNGIWSQDASGKLLEAPGNIHVSSRGGNALVVGWDPVSGASGYEIYVSKTSDGNLTRAGVTETCEFEYSGLQTDDVRYFVIQSLCTVDGKTGIGECSAYIKGVVELAIPQILTVGPGGANYSLKITWTQAPKAESYGILRSESQDSGYQWIGAVSGLSYTDAGLDPQKTYYYKIYATRKIDGQWQNGAWSEAGSGSVCPGPADLYVETASTNAVKLSWSAVSGASAYAVYRVENGQLRQVGTSFTPEYTDSGLAYGVQYTYLVQTMVYVDGQWALGGTGNYASGTPGVRKVSGVDAVVSSTDAVVTLSWSESPGAQLYGVLRADQENGAYQWLSAVSGTSFQDITAHPEKTYYYKIDGAVSVGGVWENGENSDAFSVYVPRAARAMGIDVSYHNGAIDWTRVAQSEVSFAMIRIGYRRNADGVIIEDVRAAENLQGALNAGLQVGVYFFSTAVNVQEAQEEAQWVLNYISRYPITYPVAYDCEGYGDATSRMYLAGLTKTQRTDHAVTFLNMVSNAGYEPLMYGSKYHLVNSWELDRLENIYPIWVAQWPSQVPVYPNLGQSTYGRVHKMWQYTDKGTIPGIKGDVDLDLYYE